MTYKLLHLSILQTFLLSTVHVLKALSPGRVITIFTTKYHYSLAVILQQSHKTLERSFTVLMLCNSGDEAKDVANSLVSIDQCKGVTPYKPLTELFHPEGVVKHAVVEVNGQLIVNIIQEVLSVEPARIIEDYNRRQIPRFQ